ncbi:MAG: BrnT family toxin [Terriglobia bacterium]
MAELRFEWDERKNAQNRRRHSVSFEEAQTVFFDEHALLITDPDHSEHEERFILLGLSSRLRVLVVCHCIRRRGEVIRIISARRADPQERDLYAVRWKE